MSKIVNLQLYKATKVNNHRANQAVGVASAVTSIALPLSAKINQETKKLLTAWIAAETTDSLQQYIKQQTNLIIPSLQLIKNLEDQLGIPIAVLSPICSQNGGWSAGFKYEGELVMSPPFNGEEYARIFAIIMFKRLC